LIFYQKVENDIVEIVRVLPQSMDLKKRLKQHPTPKNQKSRSSRLFWFYNE
jgi:hypothetical protein